MNHIGGQMKSICVFCGSSPGRRTEYHDAARALGAALALHEIKLVYGGGRVGLMGILADSVLAAGGSVTGVIPEHLWEREVGHSGLSELHIVHSMHERKAMMANLSDAFVALPGGIGTLEEFFEIWTWGQLGLHKKPFGILNVAGYYTLLAQLIDHMVAEQFLPEQHRALVLIDDDPARLLARLAVHRPETSDKWISADKT
jgi:uncharacterized protein (TIGR00730 family)